MTPVARRKCLLARDARLPQRDYLLNTAEMSRYFASQLQTNIDDCEKMRVKYRFGENLRVLYKLRREENSMQIAARTFRAERGKKIYETYMQNAAHYSQICPVWFDEELQTVFWTFPNDRKISNLHVLNDIPADLKNKNWKESRIIAYAPEKCATAQCLDETGKITAYAKVFAGVEGRRIYEIYNLLKEKNLNVPRALFYSESHRTLILEAVNGTRVADLLLENQSEIYAKFGAAIARLHQISPPANLTRFTRLSINRLPRVLEAIQNVQPELAPQTAKLAEKLAETFEFDTESEVCLHGDVHAKNVIWQDGALTLIDLDQISVGQAACDVGSFLAGLEYKKCTGELAAKKCSQFAESFLSGYAQARALPPEKSLRWHTAMALFAERAARSISRVRVDGLNCLGEILKASEKILEGENKEI
jgi:tRNA A-37 threonylcarbamoyl transferase component Bud32